MPEPTDQTDKGSRKRGAYARRGSGDVISTEKCRSRKLAIKSKEVREACKRRLRQSGASTGYMEDMHIKALVREERAKRADRVKPGDVNG